MLKKKKLFRMNKGVFSIVSLTKELDEKEYWQKRPKAERMEALEFLRNILYKGYHGATSRLQRVFSIAQRKTN